MKIHTNVKHTYKGAAADVDADDALIAEPEERDEEEGEENKQGRKSEEDSRS